MIAAMVTGHRLLTHRRANRRRFVWVLALALPLLAGACASPEPARDTLGSHQGPLNVAVLVDAGDRALERGDASSATLFYRAAVRNDPADPLATERLRAITGGAPEALPAAEPAPAEDPATQTYMLARSLLEAGQAAAAVSVYRASVALEPSARAHNGLGLALALDGHPGEAERAFRAALEIDPGHAASRTNLALHLALDGRADAALAVASELEAPAATRRDRSNLALIRTLAGDVSGAMALLDAGDPAALRREIAYFLWLAHAPVAEATAALAGLNAPDPADIAALTRHVDRHAVPQFASAEIGATIAPGADDAPTMPDPEPTVSEGMTITVQSGDSLWTIAERHYGDPLRFQEIFEANTDTLASADRIVPGQTLVLP